MNHAGHARCNRGRSSKDQQHSWQNSKSFRLLFPLAGLASLIWVLVRVIPKPSRAQYPCMKVAAPLASTFVAYIAGLAGALFAFKKARHYLKNSNVALGLLFLVFALTLGLFSILKTDTESQAMGLLTDSLFVPSDPPNTPMGTAKGIFPGRVVWMWDSTATTWNGTTGNWYNDAYTHQQVVDSMMSKSLRTLTGKSTDDGAWDALFKYFNAHHGKGSVGYQPHEKIAVKINLVTTSFPGNVYNSAFAAPQTVLALMRELVTNAGVSDTDITLYDTDRYVPDPIYTKVHAAFPGVHFMGWQKINGREQYVRDTTIVHWSHPLTMEINGGHPAHLPTVVTQASYLINLGSFKAHRYMGVTFCSKNHFGTLSADGNDGNPAQGAPHAAGLHCYTAVHDIYIQGSPEWTFTGNPMGTYNTLVDLMGHKDLGAKTLLFMIDALYGVEQEGAQVSLASRWLSAPFNNHWTSSLFMSQDNLAIESVGLDFFRTEQSMNKNYTNTYGAVDNYLHEGAQADNPPSGTFYHPNGDSVRLQSLGVHEHWNNAQEKKYTRNLGTGNGIELIQPQGVVTAVRGGEGTPTGFALSQNYPNPFNPSTTITFTLPKAGDVSLVVYDMAGRHVRTLMSGQAAPGQRSVVWDGKDEKGAAVASGVYFYQLRAGQGPAGTKKMVLTK